LKGVRPEIAAMQQNGITGLATPRLGDQSVIPLWFGEGDEPTADVIREAGANALLEGDTFYVNTRGKQALRTSIGDYLQSIYGLEIDLDRISVPGSSMMGVTIAVQMALTQGDEALLVGPYWPNIETACRVAGADIVTVRQHELAHTWCLDMDALFAAVTPKTRLIYINSPCNPTGWVMSREQQSVLLDFCRQKEILLLADEVYHRTVYSAEVAPSFVELARDDDPIVIVNGFSKAWAMTGWRAGWVVTAKAAVTQWAVLSECFNTGTPPFVQEGCLVALENSASVIGALNAKYQQGLLLVNEILATCPRIRLTPPEGAFYAFPKIDGISSSRAFCQGLLDQKNVGAAPGFTFGPDNEQYIRVCFALSHARLQEGLEKLVLYANNYKE